MKELRDLKDLTIHEQKEYPPGSHFRPVSDWFASCMDTSRVEELGATPLDPYLAKIEGIHDKVLFLLGLPDYS